MDNSVLFELIGKLSYNSRCQVQHLVIDLVNKARGDAKNLGTEDPFKDYQYITADDFDAPLKEFHEYMYHISIEFVEKIEKLPIDLQKALEASVDEMLTTTKG